MRHIERPIKNAILRGFEKLGSALNFFMESKCVGNKEKFCMVVGRTRGLRRLPVVFNNNYCQSN